MGFKRTAFAAVLLLGSTGWALAQSIAPSATTGYPPNAPSAAPSVGTSANPHENSSRAGNAGLEPGANSFTEAQARRRIEDHGYTNIGQLHKDQNSIWQAEAMKDGRQVHVAVDFHGNVAEQNR